MKRQIIGLDQNAGRHNLSLRQSGNRILTGGSWKRQRIVYLLPAGPTIPTRAHISHMNLIFPPNQPVFRMATVGMEVGEAYTAAIDQVLAHPELSKWEFLLTIEHDNLPPSDGVLKLLARLEANRHLSAVSGLYWTKGEGGVPQIWGDPKDPQVNFRPQYPRPGELQEARGCGMGFCVFRIDLFKDERLRRPWFKTVAGREGVGTQDLHFWTDAHQWGYRCAVDNDCLVGHYDVETDTVW